MTVKDTQAIKGVAICLMLWHHLFWNTADYGAVSQAVGILGKVCVSLFLFLSGYGLSVQYRQTSSKSFHETLRFLLVRLVKLYFAFWPCLIVVMLVGTLSGYSFHEAYPDHLNPYKCLLLDCLGMTGYNSYLPEWWYMRMIVQLYLLFPLLYLLLCRRGIALLSLCGAVATLFLPQVGVMFIDEGGLGPFFLGMVCSTLPARQMKTGIVLPLALLMGGFFAWLGLQKSLLLPQTFSLMGLAFSIAIVIRSLRNHYAFPVMMFLGKHSGTMYFTHSLFLILIPSVIYFTRFTPLIFLWFLLIALGVALLIDQAQRLTRYRRLQERIVQYLNQV